MKLRLVAIGDKKFLYCPNGSIMAVDQNVLYRLLHEFHKPTNFRGHDGYWTEQTSDMSGAQGKTLAVVDDTLSLIIYSPKTFDAVKSPVEYISASEYADMHGCTPAIIKRYCYDDRIEGAQKIRGCWLIPKNAPYPDRKPREVKKEHK